jgi:hypothetical protein
MSAAGKRSTSHIALLTDFSWHNSYIGVMKGVILGINPAVRVVDLCHNISSQDVREGSFVLANSYRYFPAGTIFCCVIDPGVGGDRKNIVVDAGDRYFVGPDNGVLSAVFEDGAARKVYEVKPGEHTLPVHGATFLGRDVFAPIAAHLSLGVPPSQMGQALESVLIVPAQKPFINRKGEISGRAVYVDTFGNIITNIDETFLSRSLGASYDPDSVSVRIGTRRINGLKRYYEQGNLGRLMALINSWGYLEIAVNRGNAFELLGLTEKKSLEAFVTAGGRDPDQT